MQTSGASAQRLGAGPPGGPEPCPGGKQPVAGERRPPGLCRLGTRMPHPSGGSGACRMTPGAGALCPGRPGAGLGAQAAPSSVPPLPACLLWAGSVGVKPGKAHSVFHPSGAHM